MLDGELGLDAAAAHDEICRQLRALLSDPSSAEGPSERSSTWKAIVQPSSAPGAGDGVYIDGTCSSGTVLAVYPGMSYHPEDLPVMHELVLKNNSYVLARRDGILIDGRPDGPSRRLFEVASQRDAAAGKICSERSVMLAIAHKVNHPPAGTLPNVAVWPLDLTETEVDLLTHINTHAFRPPADGDPQKQTAVLVRNLCEITQPPHPLALTISTPLRCLLVPYAMKSCGWITS